jgi:hypothetical protein
MRYFFIIVIICLGFSSCKKGNGSAAPVIKFKSITESYISNLSTTQFQPPAILTIKISDDDGDLGFKDGKDTSYVYLKNVSIPPFKIDSFKFPASLSTLPSSAFKNFVDVEINLNASTGNGAAVLYPSGVSTRKDTTYFEVFVKDFGKNKSNLIKTDNPIILITR